MSLATIMAVVRGVHLAATLSLLGTAGFIAWSCQPLRTCQTYCAGD